MTKDINNDEQNLKQDECCNNCQDCGCKKDEIKSQDNIDNNEADELKKKADEYLNNWKRERADFVNYKKDELERTLSLIKHSSEKFVVNLLPILDNLYLAQKHLSDNGLSQVIKQFEEFLKKEGIEPIETDGKMFDPNVMEVVAEIEDEGKESGTVAEEMQKGYKLNEKVLRPAKVSIAK
ncbi:MAG: Protein GrpE [Parcubacteria group bacterium GW2011_GWC2_32_10]|nr:MAG: Protein GrpE [Parcubacteria group bacterium GW2011_GWC2_32_10]